MGEAPTRALGPAPEIPSLATSPPANAVSSAALDNMAGGGAALVKEPVLYLRLDPGWEWLVGGEVLQDQDMWEAMLLSKDVVSQTLGVR